MSNTLKGEIPLTLSDGRELVLVMDMEGMFEAEQLYKQPLEVVFAQAALGLKGALRALLWGMLRAKHPELTPQDVTDIVFKELDAVIVAMDRAGEAARAKQSGEGKDGENPPGTTSGASGAKRGSTRKPSGGQRRARSKSSSARA